MQVFSSLVFCGSRLDDSSALLQECRITRFGKKIAAKNCDDKWVLILHHHWKSIRNDVFVSRHLFLIKFVNFSAVTAIASSALLRTNQTPSVWGVSVLYRSLLSLVGYPVQATWTLSLPCFLQIEEYNIDTEFYPSGIKNYRTFFRWEKFKTCSQYC